MNHRLGLDDAVLIKDNHIAVAGGIVPALRAAKAAIGHLVKIEIEVDTLAQLSEVIAEGADVVVLDNMINEQLREAFAMVGGKMLCEALGNVTLAGVRAIAETGVDIISSGALTHSASNLDLGSTSHSINHFGTLIYKMLVKCSENSGSFGRGDRC